MATEFPLPYMSGYNVAKAGLSALSESLIQELRGTGIRMIDFRPGDYRTSFNSGMQKQEVAEESGMEKTWERLEQNLHAAPPASHAAADLRKALMKGRSGIVRSGSFFRRVWHPCSHLWHLLVCAVSRCRSISAHTDMSRVRILVLTSSTGGGHDARAEAFAEWCFQLYRHDVDVRIEQMLEKSSVFNRGGVNFYNWIQKHAPFLHTGFYSFVELLSYLNRNSVHFGKSYFVKVLKEYRPHLVFSVHDCLNRGYFQLARKVLGAKNVRCATYCGEFSGGWGYSKNWIEPSVDLYISRTPTAGILP